MGTVQNSAREKPTKRISKNTATDADRADPPTSGCKRMASTRSIRTPAPRASRASASKREMSQPSHPQE
eukprot:2106631-Prymnesium_polylepis.2